MRPAPHTPPRARRLLAGALTALLAFAAGCGKHDLVLHVDILSFTPELQSPFVFPPVPAAPGGLATGEQALVNDQSVNLLEGLGDATTIKDVSLRLRSVADATTGNGTDTLRVYLSDANTPPRNTSPALTQILTFTAGAPDTVTSELGGDPRLIALMSNKQLRVSVTTSFRGPTSGAALSGRLTVIGLDAVVVAGRKL